MSRPLRIQFPAAVYHVTNRGAARQPTFADDKGYQVFLDTVAGAHRLWMLKFSLLFDGERLSSLS